MPEIQNIQKLISGLVSGDERSWQYFFEKFHPLIEANAARYSFYVDIDDAIQAVYEKLMADDFTLLRKFNGESENSFIVYILKVSRHQIWNINTVEKNRRPAKQVDIVESLDIEDRADTPDEVYAKKELSERLSETINSLDTIYREVIVLVLRGYKHREIAEILNIPLNTATTRISRAREKIQKILENSEIILS